VRLPVPAKRIPGLRGPAGALEADETATDDVALERG